MPQVRDPGGMAAELGKTPRAWAGAVCRFRPGMPLRGCELTVFYLWVFSMCEINAEIDREDPDAVFYTAFVERLVR